MFRQHLSLVFHGGGRLDAFGLGAVLWSVVRMFPVRCPLFLPVARSVRLVRLVAAAGRMAVPVVRLVRFIRFVRFLARAVFVFGFVALVSGLRGGVGFRVPVVGIRLLVSVVRRFVGFVGALPLPADVERGLVCELCAQRSHLYDARLVIRRGGGVFLCGIGNKTNSIAKYLLRQRFFKSS